MQWSLVVPIALLWLVSLTLPQVFFHRFADATNSRFQGRFDIWQVGWQIIRHHPLIGIGFENFRVGYQNFADYAQVFRGLERAPHNIYIETWAEGGIVSLTLLIIAIWSHLKAARRGRGGKRDFLQIGIEAACWAIIVHGAVANHLWRKQFWMSWILLILVLKTNVMSRHDEQPEPVELEPVATLDSA
jgi:O-antigen ligase